MYVEWAGQGAGLVFLHAGIADSRMWDSEFEWFRRSHRVVRFDTRGFGRSPMPSGRFAYHDDVAAVARVAGLTQATLVGCSFGADCSIDTALAHPGLVERLVLVSPALGGGGDSAEMRRFGEEEEAALERGDLDGATELNLRMWVDGPHRGAGDVDAGVRERVRVMQLDAFRVAMPEEVERVRLEPPAASRLGDLRVPTLVVVGDLDVRFVLASAERIERELSGARRVVVRGAAHMVNLERTAQFRRILEDFV